MTRPAPARPYPVPRYGESSLAELMPSALAALGLPGEANALGLDPAQRVCVVLIDGLGWELLKDHGAEAPFLAGLAAHGRPLSAAFPTTTVTSLASLGTGLPPGQHGMFGYRVAVPSERRLLNGLRWDQPVVPEQWQPRATAFERATSHSIPVTQVAPAAFRTGGLTRAALRGATYVGADTVEDRAMATLTALVASAPSLVYAYIGEVDAAGHDAGLGSPEWLAALADADRLVARLAERLPEDALLYVTGDHGMVNVPIRSRVDVDAMPELRDGVDLLGGDTRVRYVYTAAGARDDVLATWREVLADKAWVLDRDDAIAAGWFGPVADWARPRLGDVIAACHSDYAVVATLGEPRESGLFGMHGSLTSAELDVPLLRYPPTQSPVDPAQARTS